MSSTVKTIINTHNFFTSNYLTGIFAQENINEKKNKVCNSFFPSRQTLDSCTTSFAKYMSLTSIWFKN